MFKYKSFIRLVIVFCVSIIFISEMCHLKSQTNQIPVKVGSSGLIDISKCYYTANQDRLILSDDNGVSFFDLENYKTATIVDTEGNWITFDHNKILYSDLQNKEKEEKLLIRSFVLLCKSLDRNMVDEIVRQAGVWKIFHPNEPDKNNPFLEELKNK